ncbi:DUF2225 domain-containing protein [Natroniella sulfidigena]|uniref:DUF2225 domain-containing protein n=1 Tax=Natroniella sulfidigena TaxID=723921 RepID=UPI002009EE62|nr:DUF2225 domain-containing protein [Natroniella sulfidigena]MCK8817872.1 DUF2225 domain-containing protein [Natroniella sulfidigena]
MADSINTSLGERTRRQITAGEDIFSYGEAAVEIYLVIKGLVRLFTKNKDGQEEEVTRFTAGHIFGELALLEEGTRSSRATAYQDTLVVVFTAEEMKELMQKQPVLNQKLITGLCKRIQILQKPVIDLPELTEVLGSDEKEKVQKQTAKAEEGIDLYLSGHGDYSEITEDNFDHYLYSKEIECPVCNAKIEVKKVRQSRLRLQEIRDDLRPIYKNFKPEWYKIWCCPECFYTARKASYFDLEPEQKSKIRAEFKAKIQQLFGDDYQVGYSQPRQLTEVFNAYYVSLQLYKLIDASKDNFAYIWLRLSWIYEDLEEEKLSSAASFRAMENLRDFYFSSSNQQGSDQEDKLALLLAMLCYRHGEIKEAISVLGKLVHNPKTKHVHKQMAKERYLDLRAEQRKNRQE